jgi:hypothetical protein
VLTVLTLLAVVPAAPTSAASIAHRVNAGGPSLGGTPAWSEDSSASPSPFVNAAETGNKTFVTSSAIDMSDPSVPAGTPTEVFQSERWDGGTAPEMEWNFPVTAGTHEVRLYFAETYSGTQSVGARVFDVLIEGTVVLDDYDVFADVGGHKGVVKSFVVSSDANLDIDFGHVVQNPAIKGIEVLRSESANQLGAAPANLDFGTVALNSTSTQPVQLTNLGGAGDPSIVVDATSITGTNASEFSDDFDDTLDVTLAPGESTTVQVSLTPTASGSKSATLEVAHSGANSPVGVALAGEGGSAASAGTWEARAPSGPSRQEVSYVNAGGKLYLAGGGTAHEAYDPASDTWSTVASLPQGLDHVQGVEVGGLVYYVGGLTGFPGPHLDTVYVYDPATDSFTQGSPMPAGRGRGAGGVAVHDGKIYYAGGLHDGAAVPWFDVYDPATDSWTQLVDMPQARDHFHAAVVDGKFYVTGGRNLDINATTAATDAYDFGVGSWSTGLAPIPTPRGGFAAAVLGTEILVIGGEGGGNAYATVEAYDTTTDTWRALSPMPTPRHGIQAATCGGGVYIAAGGTVQAGGSPTNVHEVFFFDEATTCGAPAPTPTTTDFKVNAGGPSLSGTPAWSEDSSASPSPFVNAAETGNKTFVTSSAIDMSDPSVPAGTPTEVFQSERWDGGTAPEMEWNFPVTAGTHEVRLYFAETYSGTQSVGARVFDVLIEGTVVLDDYDVFADVGGHKGVVKSFVVSSDANLDIDFGHVVQNPAIKGIEVLRSESANQLGAAPANLDFGTVALNSTSTQPVQLTNLGGAGDPSIVVDATSITGTNASEFSDDFDDTLDVTLAPGESTTVQVSLTPTASGSKSATLEVAHSGANSPVGVALAGTAGTTISFNKSVLGGATSSRPTSLQFGPDGRLYVAQQDGVIKIYEVARSGANTYSVSATETVTEIQAIPNHDDDGTLNTAVDERLVTGILVTGTAANPVIYVTSSDPRIGGGSSGADLRLDTNSSMLSRLTWNGSSWARLDLVRGLPRSEENHASNGMQLDAANNILYIVHGGNTNKGAPSNNFARLPEFALSAAVLSVDLAAIGESTYDLPTLDDDSRPGDPDANDPYGGNNGKNQAKLVTGGPVQVHAPGFRNAYDLVIHSNGKFYTVDNGGNAGWGDVPVNEGPEGKCTNEINEPGTTEPDMFHLVRAAGYGGHPNPTRGNMANTFNSPGQSPVTVANAVECDYRAPGPERGNLADFPASTNGLVEYTASNFDGAMTGDLLTAGFDNKIYRVKLNGSGDGVLSKSVLFSTVDALPLDVTAQGNDGAFPGTVWVGDIQSGNIVVFEPADFSEPPPPCTGADDPSLDEDGDGFTNADEIDNATDPCSAADVPPDHDGDKVSNLNDPDDDNDGLPDTSDPFAIDADNGMTTAAPVHYSWDNDAPKPGGLLNLGFTGLMTNGTSDYETLFDAAKMTAGGAAGVTTVDEVSEGSALGSTNTQEYGFQFGVVPSATQITTAHTRILAPFAGITPEDNQSMGLFIGPGDQDNYAKLVVSANGGPGGIQFLTESNATVTERPQGAVDLPGPDAIDLFLEIDPVAETVQPSYVVTSGGVAGPRTDLGGPEPVPTSWIAGGKALAVGIISTSEGPAPPFPATWDFIGLELSERPPPCTGADDPSLDEDGDGFTNADEIDNATDPCSAADVPPDHDGDKVSNLNDPDDDNDGLPDTSDPFAIDADNGMTTAAPVHYSWDNDAPKPGGLLNLGFTGLMTNGTSDYETLFDAAKMTAGGAAGVTTVDEVSEGSALGSTNTQEYGFQFGVVPSATQITTAHTRILAPFAGITPEDNQSMGLFIGPGDQDNYAKLVVSANGGPGGIQFLTESNATVTERPQGAVDLPGPDAIDLFLEIDPVAETVQPSYVVTSGGVAGPRTDLGGPEPVPTSWIAGGKALAVGIISTSEGPAPPFPATWDFIGLELSEPFALDVLPYKVKGFHHVDLAWSGATTETVDIFRDGVVVASGTPNDGAHTDVTENKGKGEYVYQVCEAGTSTCSPKVRATF